MAVYLGLKISKKDPPQSNIPELLYGNRDIPYLLKSYNITFFAAASLHVLVLSQVAFQFLDMSSLAMVVSSTEGAKLTVLSLVIMVWCFFTTWDLHRTCIIRTRYFSDICYLCVSFLFFGPAAALISMWKRREIALEKPRRGKRGAL
jgi:hypothetical protein